MKFITSKDSIARKIVIVLLIALTLTFAIVPNYSVYATEVLESDDLPDESFTIGGTLLQQLIQLVDGIADIVMGALNKFMVGADGFTSAMLEKDDVNIGNEKSWLYAGNVADDKVDFEFGDGTIDTSWFGGKKYSIPNFLYSPEAIFSNNIASLDVNFLNPNTYVSVSNSEEANTAAISGAGENGLQKIIANWYISFRNIAIVGLLSVLIYLGIRILISSTAADKAKYKENLQNWVVALCLVFFMHYIMSGLLMITDKVTELFDSTANNSITVLVDDGHIKFRTNLIGYIRFSAQSKSTYNTVAYSLLYLILVIYTVVFTFMYFKRFLYMAFLTMIAPLVALTYPIDKAGDGKAQAFNMWFKEYVMHLVLQPVHLILYVALVSSAMDLVKNNMIYGIVAIGFLIPAENLIKKMFNLNKAETTSGIGSFAGGALTMQGLNKVASAIGGRKSKENSGSGKSSESNEVSNNRIRTQDRSFLQSFGNDNNRQNPQLTNEQINNNQEDNEQTNVNSQDPERQRMMEDRERTNDENVSEFDREESEQQLGIMNDNMRDGVNPDNGQPDRIRENNLHQPIQANKGWKRKRALKGAKKALKGAYKGAKILTTVGGAAGGALVGVAAGAATGDASKVFTYASAGALAGKTIGGAVSNLPEKVTKKGTDIRDSYNNFKEENTYEKEKAERGIKFASEQAAIRQNNRDKAKFMKNEAEKKKYEEMAGRISQKTGKDMNTEELMNLAFDYKKAGIIDEKQIENGLTVEKMHDNDNNIHENMIDIVGMTKEYGKDYVLDEKKRNTMQETIKAKVNGEQNQDKVWKLYTETLGLKERGEQYSMNRRREPINPNGNN